MSVCQLLISWIDLEAHRQTGPEGAVASQAVPAVTSAYISPCVLNMVHEETDLVILEFTFNDAERATTFDLDDPTRCDHLPGPLLWGFFEL